MSSSGENERGREKAHESGKGGLITVFEVNLISFDMSPTCGFAIQILSPILSSPLSSVSSIISFLVVVELWFDRPMRREGCLFRGCADRERETALGHAQNYFIGASVVPAVPA
mmetsp:Transcript_15972/g.32398  ORF Transcript_15972/g.32398 Transcript_15972/m.32398 type:complete len:113 (-) Transcript_15972:308-646(-)